MNGVAKSQKLIDKWTNKIEEKGSSKRLEERKACFHVFDIIAYSTPKEPNKR